MLPTNAHILITRDAHQITVQGKVLYRTTCFGADIFCAAADNVQITDGMTVTIKGGCNEYWNHQSVPSLRRCCNRPHGNARLG
jgi:hypothetical protein